MAEFQRGKVQFCWKSFGDLIDVPTIGMPFLQTSCQTYLIQDGGASHSTVSESFCRFLNWLLSLFLCLMQKAESDSQVEKGPDAMRWLCH